jgi:hypothetical protein
MITLPPTVRFGGGCLFALTLFALAGCTDRSMSEVRGTITVDGKAIEKGTIAFFPKDRKSQTTGGDIKDGAYSVQVPVGVMEVQISMPKVVGHKKLYDRPDSPSYPLTAEALPEKYNKKSVLQLDVAPGGVTKDWDLSSK